MSKREGPSAISSTSRHKMKSSAPRVHPSVPKILQHRSSRFNRGLCSAYDSNIPTMPPTIKPRPREFSQVTEIPCSGGREIQKWSAHLSERRRWVWIEGDIPPVVSPVLPYRRAPPYQSDQWGWRDNYCELDKQGIRYTWFSLAVRMLGSSTVGIASSDHQEREHSIIKGRENEREGKGDTISCQSQRLPEVKPDYYNCRFTRIQLDDREFLIKRWTMIS